MNILLWILQVVLALLCLAGGAYKLFQFDELAKVPATAALARVGWGAISVIEMLCTVLLIVPVGARLKTLVSSSSRGTVVAPVSAFEAEQERNRRVDK
jgi:hypothetical protein